MLQRNLCRRETLMRPPSYRGIGAYPFVVSVYDLNNWVATVPVGTTYQAVIETTTYVQLWNPHNYPHRRFGRSADSALSKLRQGKCERDTSNPQFSTGCNNNIYSQPDPINATRLL